MGIFSDKVSRVLGLAGLLLAEPVRVGLLPLVLLEGELLSFDDVRVNPLLDFGLPLNPPSWLSFLPISCEPEGIGLFSFERLPEGDELPLFVPMGTEERLGGVP